MPTYNKNLLGDVDELINHITTLFQDHHHSTETPPHKHSSKTPSLPPPEDSQRAEISILPSTSQYEIPSEEPISDPTYYSSDYPSDVP